MDAEPLARTGFQVIRYFSRIRQAEETLKDKSDFPMDALVAEADRFELWATNTGLFLSGHGSLDYRVREAEGIRLTLHRFLGSLTNALDEVLQYISDPANLSDGLLNGPELDSDEEEYSIWDLLVESIQDPIGRLYKLAVWIRNPASRLMPSKARFHKQVDPDTNVDLFSTIESFDLDYIQSVFRQHTKWNTPGATHSEASANNVGQANHFEGDEKNESRSLLMRRLARANVSRRRQFAYWKECRQKLKDCTLLVADHVEESSKEFTDQNFPRPEYPKTLEIARMPAEPVTTAMLLDLSRVLPQDNDSDVTVSQYAPSMRRIDQESVEFPFPPRKRAKDGFFECPYCFTMCPGPVLRERAWKAHLIHDLRPYVCIDEMCMNSNQLYDCRSDWIQHMSSSHPNADNLSCPICLRSFGEPKSMYTHVALHLERMSLFALPRLVDVYGEDQSDVGSNEAVQSLFGSAWEGLNELENLSVTSFAYPKGEQEENQSEINSNEVPSTTMPGASAFAFAGNSRLRPVPPDSLEKILTRVSGTYNRGIQLAKQVGKRLAGQGATQTKSDTQVRSKKTDRSSQNT